jgi:hypothetical protein
MHKNVINQLNFEIYLEKHYRLITDTTKTNTSIGLRPAYEVKLIKYCH